MILVLAGIYYRGAAEGMKEDNASWVSFFQWLRGWGLERFKPIVGDKCLGMLETVGKVFSDAKHQRCVVHLYRNVFSVVPIKNVAKMLKAIHVHEGKKAAREKATAVIAELKAMKLPEVAKKVADGIIVQPSSQMMFQGNWGELSPRRELIGSVQVYIAYQFVLPIS